MTELHRRKCVPCEGDVTPLVPPEIEKFLKQVPKWKMSEDGKGIWREFKFKDFQETMDFVEKIADVAEEEDHHPDLHISYSLLRVELTTHAVGGLSENDFILAAKIDKIW